MLLALFLHLAAPAALGGSFVFDQAPQSIPISLDLNGRRARARLELPTLSERLTFAPGRQVILARVDRVPAVLSLDGESSGPVFLSFSELTLTADARGAAEGRRTVRLTSPTGHRFAAELALDLELDLLGLGGKEASVSLRRASFVEINKGGGELASARLLKPAVLALPEAPLKWPATKSALLLSSSASAYGAPGALALVGTLGLDPALSPDYFLNGERPLFEVSLYSQGGIVSTLRGPARLKRESATRMSFVIDGEPGLVIRWEKLNTWTGTLELSGAKVRSVERLAVRLGDLETPYSISADALLATETAVLGAHPSGSPSARLSP